MTPANRGTGAGTDLERQISLSKMIHFDAARISRCRKYDFCCEHILGVPTGCPTVGTTGHPSGTCTIDHKLHMNVSGL